MAAAATLSMPMSSNMELGQQLNMAQYDRLVKQEVSSSDYTNMTQGQQHQHNNPHLPPLPHEADLAPVLSGYCPQEFGAPPEKAKRGAPRKPSGSPKPKKVKSEPTAANGDSNSPMDGASQSQIPDHMPVQKKKRDRFKGTTEEEVLTRVLPDHIREDLDILIVGINPGLTAAYVQHHYAGPGNHFWKCLFLSGMIPQPMNAMQDAELMNYGIGFTNIVARTTRGSADLSRKEIAEGGEILKEKMLKYLPKIALFNGKGIYEVFCGHKKFNFGLQPEPFPGCPDTVVFVNPSSSARCTQLPRAQDKVVFYQALKRVRDHIRAHGSIDGIDRSTVTFPDFKLVTAPQKVKKEVKDEPTESNEDSSNPTNLQPPAPAPTQAKPPPKPRKPRGRPKKEKGAPADSPVGGSTPQAGTPQPTVDMNNSMSQSNHAVPTSMYNNMGNGMHSQMSHEQLTKLTQSRQQQPHNNTQHAFNPNLQDFTLKQEVTDNRQHNDKDLAAIIQQSINVQQSMFQHQQQSMAATMMQHSMNGGGLHHGLMMPVSVPSSVKQERPEWPGNGYGVMPPSTSAATSMAAYPQYSCYWNYLPHSNGGSFMTNPYSNIPNPQIAHHQAVAAATALHTSVNVSQAQPQVSSTPAVATYNSPQEASSPAMSSQSNLTQASLDSLPKADSASTVANWLQNIPNSSA